MMLELGDDGTVTSVNEEELVYVDKNEFEKFFESYQQLEKENNHLQKENLNLLGLLGDIRALARMNDIDAIITKINKVEKEVLK